MFNIGDEVEIAFNPMPPDERHRLEQSRSGKKQLPSKVDQPNHQKKPDWGIIEGVLPDNQYMVAVRLTSKAGDISIRKRVVSGKKLSLR